MKQSDRCEAVKPLKIISLVWKGTKVREKNLIENAEFNIDAKKQLCFHESINFHVYSVFIYNFN